ncbi:MAG: hypothetical protein H0Z35_02275 [Thermoanaerobacteraceae bacterium]|nr:hypothetical protein [Thermoanaerobacteraceae bacterium]
MAWVFLLVGIFLLLLTVPQLIKEQKADTGESLSYLQRQLKELSREKQQLEEQLAKQQETAVALAAGVEEQLALVVDSINALQDRMKRWENVLHNLNSPPENSFRNVMDEVSKQLTLFEEIYRDYDLGKSVTEIAQKYNRGKGEIELILSLRKQDVG